MENSWLATSLLFAGAPTSLTLLQVLDLLPNLPLPVGCLEEHIIRVFGLFLLLGAHLVETGYLLKLPFVESLDKFPVSLRFKMLDHHSVRV